MSDANIERAYAHGMQQRGAQRDDCPAAEHLQLLALEAHHDDASLVQLDHVMSCSACMAEYELLRATHLATGAASPRTRRASRFLLPVTTLLAASVLVFVVVNRSPREGGPGVDVNPTGAVTRGNDAAVGQVTFVSAATDLRRGDSLRVVWNAVPQASAYRVDLLDGNGDVLATRTSSDTVVALGPEVVPSSEPFVEWLVVARRADGNVVRSELRRVTLR